MAAIAALLDANVLYPAAMRDLLLRLAAFGLYRALWTDRIHDEWIRSVLADRPDLTRERLDRTRKLMDAHAADCLVGGYDHLIEALDLPDTDDRHVLAAAIHSRADVVVTSNLPDFPASSLMPHGLTAIHPDAFMLGLLDRHADAFMSVVRQHRSALTKPALGRLAYLDRLGAHGLPGTATALGRRDDDF